MREQNCHVHVVPNLYAILINSWTVYGLHSLKWPVHMDSGIRAFFARAGPLWQFEVCMFPPLGMAFFLKPGPHWLWEVCVCWLCQVINSVWGPVLTDSVKCVCLLFLIYCFLCEVRSSLTVWRVYVSSIRYWFLCEVRSSLTVWSVYVSSIRYCFFLKPSPHGQCKVCVFTLLGKWIICEDWSSWLVWSMYVYFIR